MSRAETYEFTSRIPAGQTVEYALLRNAEGRQEVHLEGSLVVREGRQVITLGYDYPGSAVAPSLPDTAMLVAGHQASGRER